MEESSYALYAVSFSQGDTVRVVILEAEDTAKAEIYVRDAFGEQLTNVKIKTIDIIGTGIIQCVYEKKESK